MSKYQLYNWDTMFGFGKHKGKKVRDVFKESPNYISWCFQKIDWFCLSDDVFNSLPLIISLREENKIDNVKDQKDWLSIMTDKHIIKKSKLRI